MLSSSRDTILLTIQNEDNSQICVTFNIDSDSLSQGLSTFSKEVKCTDYTNDILSFSADSDPTTTRINSISARDGIDITRDTHSFKIGWDQIPEANNITLSVEELSYFTLSDDYTTLVQITDENMYAIKFESELSNAYKVHIVNHNQESIDLASNVQSYAAYKFIKFGSCKPALYQYSTAVSNDDYNLNVSQIENGWNINVDTTNNLVFFWGYSASFQVYDILNDSLSLFRYDANSDSQSNAYIVNVNLSFYISLFFCYFFLAIFV